MDIDFRPLVHQRHMNRVHPVTVAMVVETVVMVMAAAVVPGRLACGNVSFDQSSLHMSTSVWRPLIVSSPYVGGFLPGLCAR